MQEKKATLFTPIENPKIRILDDLKDRNKDNMKTIAGEYFGAKYTYAQTFKMIEEYKTAFIAVDGLNEHSITISAPSTIASVNAFYGAMDANKPVNLTGPGFLHAYTEKYTKNLDSETVFIYDGFLSDDLIDKLHSAGAKNLIVTSIADYMSPVVKMIATQKGVIKKTSFIDEYIKRHKSFPIGMEVFSVKDFADIGKRAKETYDFPYEENKLAARFLTGATTSQFPKCVKTSADGFTKMARIYDHAWIKELLTPKTRLGVFIPIFYATGAIHGIYGGLINGMTLVYKPKYDRFMFGNDLKESKLEVAVVAPSHVATLESSGLKKGSLNHVRCIFIGGEAVAPAQMGKFRKALKNLGVKSILNGYGMTETGSMSGISNKELEEIDDVTISPLPGIQYRIVDKDTNEILSDNQRGILQVKSPCATLGYIEDENNKQLFTQDGWINTGDDAVRYPNGHYRVFGRGTDHFTNRGQSFAMFDIEEKVLELDGVAEAEVIKFDINDNEQPAIVVVPKSSADLPNLLKDIYSLDIAGMEYLIGVRFIKNFNTNPVTSKRDYLSLQTELDNYYSVDKNGDFFVLSIGSKKECIESNRIKAEEMSNK